MRTTGPRAMANQIYSYLLSDLDFGWLVLIPWNAEHLTPTVQGIAYTPGKCQANKITPFVKERKKKL